MEPPKLKKVVYSIHHASSHQQPQSLKYISQPHVCLVKPDRTKRIMALACGLVKSSIGTKWSLSSTMTPYQVGMNKFRKSDGCHIETGNPLPAGPVGAEAGAALPPPRVPPLPPRLPMVPPRPPRPPREGV